MPKPTGKSIPPANKKVPPGKSIAPANKEVKINDWLGPPVLIPGENPAIYAQLSAQLRGELKPTDPIEEMFVDEIVAAAWEVRRWRRLGGGLLVAGSQPAMQRTLTSLVDRKQAAALSEGWFRREPAAVAKVEEHLAKATLTLDVPMAESAASKIDLLARFAGLKASGEVRLSGALEELERYRSTKAKMAPPPLDADFADVPEALTKEGGADDE